MATTMTATGTSATARTDAPRTSNAYGVRISSRHAFPDGSNSSGRSRSFGSSGGSRGPASMTCAAGVRISSHRARGGVRIS